jgi:hypothetical protein
MDVLNFKFDNFANEIRQLINGGSNMEQINQKTIELTAQIANVSQISEDKINALMIDLKNILTTQDSLKTDNAKTQIDVETLKNAAQNGLPSSENQFKPDLTFQKDPTSGLAIPSVGVLNLVTDSVPRASISATGLQLDVPIFLKETKSYEPLQLNEGALIKKDNSLIWVTRNVNGEQIEIKLDKNQTETIVLDGGIQMTVTQDPTSTIQTVGSNNTDVSLNTAETLSNVTVAKSFNIADETGTIMSVNHSRLEVLGGIMEKKDNTLYFNGETLKGLQFPLRLTPENRIWAGQLTLENFPGKGLVISHDDNSVFEVNTNNVSLNLPIVMNSLSNEQRADIVVQSVANPQKSFLYKKENDLMLTQGTKEINLLERYNPIIDIEMEQDK